MKPHDWDKLPTREKEVYADQFLNTVRGRYIVGQALFIASEYMKTLPFPETSNIQDMEVLAHHPTFSMGFNITAGMRELHNRQEASHEGHQDRTGEG